MDDNRVRAEWAVAGRCLWSAMQGLGIPPTAQGLEPDAFNAEDLRVVWRALIEETESGGDITAFSLETRVNGLTSNPWPAHPWPTPMDVILKATELAGSDTAGDDLAPAVKLLREADSARRIGVLADAVSHCAGRGQVNSALAHVVKLNALAERHQQDGGALRDRWKALSETGRDWLTDTPPERDYLLFCGVDAMGRNDATERYGVLPRGKVGMLAAAGGVGKTHALTALALAVAAGTDWLGTFHVDEPGRVALLLAEEEEQEVRRRLFYAAKAMELTPSQRTEALSNLVPIGLAGELVTLADETGNETPFAGEVRARLQAGGPWALVVMDPLSRFGGPEMEKDNAVATRVVQVLERFTRASGNPTVLVAHHTTKEERKAQQNRTQGATTIGARGSSALTDGVRWVAVIQPMELDEKKADAYKGPSLLKIKITKSNYGRKPPGVWLQRLDGHEGALAPAHPDHKNAFLEAKDTRASKGNGDGNPKPVDPERYR